MERHRGERFGVQQEANHNSHPGNACSWFSDDHRPNFPDNHQHRRRHHQFDQMNGEPYEFFGGQPTPFSGRKRGFPHSGRGVSPDHIDGGIPAKLYVAAVPRTATEEDIRPLFEEHGNVVEVILPRDKRSGQQQGYCFVKYMTFEEADRAIRALNSQYTFPGEQAAIKVRYADGERERLVVAPPDKLYVGCLSKQASKKDIEEVSMLVPGINYLSLNMKYKICMDPKIFSPYGHVEDIYIVRDELKQSRGCGFVQFSHRDMALAAIKGLNGIFTMSGSDQPLIVRIADPKKPRTGELRVNHAFGGPSFGLNPQEPVRPAPSLGDSIGGRIPPNASYPLQHISSNSQPQAVPHLANQEAAVRSATQQLHSSLQQSPSQLSQVTLQQIHMPQQSSQSSQQVASEMQKHPSTQNLGQQHNSQVIRLEQSPRTGNNPQTSVSTSTAPAVPQSPHTTALFECDWSEHTCPDGYKYYFNCLTCESKWDKPEEYILFEQQLQKQQNPSQQPSSQFCVLSNQEVAQTQEVQLQSHHFHQKLQLQQSSISASLT